MIALGNLIHVHVHVISVYRSVLVYSVQCLPYINSPYLGNVISVYCFFEGTQQEMLKLEAQFLSGAYSPFQPESAALTDHLSSPPPPSLGSQANNTKTVKQKRKNSGTFVCVCMAVVRGLTHVHVSYSKHSV